MSNFRSAGAVVVVDRSRVADQIFDDLRNQIVRGDLPRGSKLPAEKDLAERYGVSGPTVREAVRGLTATGLVDVRHGSGTYVTADAVSMLALSLGAVIQLENVGAREVLSVLGILNEQSAAAAAVEGTAEEKAQVRAAMDVLDNVKDDRIAAGQAVRSFHAAIARASHNNLLSVLCGFLTDLQTELAADLAGESFEVWRGIFKELRAPRLRVVEAIEAGERDEALVAMRDFQNMSIRLITALPKAKEVHLNDPKLDAVLSAMMGRLKART